MNELVINELENKLNITKKQIETVLKLLSDGATIPFIARYRKEATGALDENQINEIEKEYTYYNNLLERKETVIRLIDEKGLLTEELKQNILKCEKLTEVEDLYRPFKEKKKTKATEAIKMGLEPLAKKIMSFPTNGDIDTLCKPFNMETSVAVENASYIIAEWISDNAYYRKYIRSKIFNNGNIISKIKKNAVDELKTYEIYYDFKDRIKYMKSYRTLAINRGEKEGILSVKINFNQEKLESYLKTKLIKNKESKVCPLVELSIKDSLKRLIIPSVEREIRSELTDEASKVSISNFSSNLKSLLLSPPMKEITVLGFDPAFRTGCKLAVLDKTGNVLDISVIYPHEPQNEKEKSKKHVLDLINKYNIDVIAIGNGTASRESEAFVSDLIKGTNTKYIIVNEAGASVYSASNLAIKEFPNLNVSERSAISIGRRLQDPLSELVKIDPKSIGVGLYQHDVKQKELSEALDFTVDSVVNNVGVNINTASKEILSHISGLTSKTIDKILKIREEKGKYKTREDLKKATKISDKIYEQAIGFIRINDGDNPLDKTSIHPESYSKTYSLLKIINSNLDELGTEILKNKLKEVDKNMLIEKLSIDKYTLDDIIKSLEKPILDPRDELVKPVLKSDILTIDNLKEGMILEGTVRNVIDFGVFVDIGLKNDGLIHISNLSNNYVKHPSDILSVGDIIKCKVLEINKDKKKVALTLKDM